MIEKYKTVLQQAEAEIIERRSRFIATVAPVKTEAEAQQFIESLKKKYWDAAHNVFAYQIGERNEIQRCSDDGEPSGTAGLPTLDMIRGEDLKDVVVVVTRYFGGTLLGTGGLVRAYGRSAKEGILAAQIVTKILYQRFEVFIDYNLMGKVQYEVLQNGYVIHDTLYTEEVTMIILVEYSQKERFEKQIIDWTSGQAKCIATEVAYGTWHNEELEFNL
ncbi:MAG: YigZ family protein [Epulopiscium sp.]|nr:YigZ family protein [Candidatus Epulonipiscium sp.]